MERLPDTKVNATPTPKTMLMLGSRNNQGEHETKTKQHALYAAIMAKSSQSDKTWLVNYSSDTTRNQDKNIAERIEHSSITEKLTWRPSCSTRIEQRPVLVRRLTNAKPNSANTNKISNVNRHTAYSVDDSLSSFASYSAASHSPPTAPSAHTLLSLLLNGFVGENLERVGHCALSPCARA